MLQITLYLSLESKLLFFFTHWNIDQHKSYPKCLKKAEQCLDFLFVMLDFTRKPDVDLRSD